MALAEDTHHLLDLLSMLPEPTDDAWPALWDLMANASKAERSARSSATASLTT
ncbi:hypothetical protein [Actinopolymorpha pittospori]|uniref:Uncharacterized protein n=1 Tax=Actinopolymorpha pittospori TaxID=648752 RepID=A0A927MR34_9ACTN|nr:hypothetical protein [Actinopolymorpha pittospori]MBE1603343.1 hypothetical protein [Actinopolymorpha pittospori]